VKSSSGDDLVIRPVAGQGVEEALRLVFRRLGADQAEHYVTFVWNEISAGAMSAEGLLEAHRGGARVGAMWVQVQPGRSGLAWPPQCVPGESGAAADRLMAAACRLLARRNVCLATALLPVVTPEDDAVLRRSGFEPLASLVYLLCQEPLFSRQQPAGTLHFEPYEETSEARMTRVVEQTYLGTLDCPALNGLRRTEDVLAGYRATGMFAPERWFFVRHEDRDVGCLLLYDHPREGNMELVYMGLIPSVRGNGWGKEMCAYAQWLTGRAGRQRLVLAVDAANAPAIEMYATAGFRAWERRTVYARTIEPEE